MNDNPLTPIKLPPLPDWVDEFSAPAEVTDVTISASAIEVDPAVVAPQTVSAAEGDPTPAVAADAPLAEGF
ncbi:hypothetical protein [Alienimonas californiensis]|uniref:Uncharacterized protein n=1 Tax=Alienimonas californiensis TaxID=2527989 RepID=A0A517PCT1_9PLAN|nr:hypothetical protein [Alienimonas californiensis]QDT17185.1 hypothetical protein CA12_32970 [Alienimonas californiensis]